LLVLPKSSPHDSPAAGNLSPLKKVAPFFLSDDLLCVSGISLWLLFSSELLALAIFCVALFFRFFPCFFDVLYPRLFFAVRFGANSAPSLLVDDLPTMAFLPHLFFRKRKAVTSFFVPLVQFSFLFEHALLLVFCGFLALSLSPGGI